jgi:hypothetical protein
MPGTNTARKCPFRMQSRIQCQRVSIDFAILRLMLSVSSDLVVAEDRGRGLRGTHVGQDLPLIGCDEGGDKGAGMLLSLSYVIMLVLVL